MPKVLEPQRLEKEPEDILADLEVPAAKPVEDGLEHLPALERTPDHLPDHQAEAVPEKKVSEKEQTLKPQAAPAVAQSPADLSLDTVLYQKVETVLEDGLGDVYQKLSPAKQQEFKVKGEETTKKITQLMQQTKIQVKKVFSLIIGWLKIIPGVNKFFLEQEAKIKTDRILDLKNKGE
jgi:hypothetical protein